MRTLTIVAIALALTGCSEPSRSGAGTDRPPGQKPNDEAGEVSEEEGPVGTDDGDDHSENPGEGEGEAPPPNGGGEGEGEGQEPPDGDLLCGLDVELDDGCGQGTAGDKLGELWEEAVLCESAEDCVILEGVQRGWCACGRTAVHKDADGETLRCLQQAWTNNYMQKGCPLPGCPAPPPGMCDGDADCQGGRCVILSDGPEEF